MDFYSREQLITTLLSDELHKQKMCILLALVKLTEHISKWF